ncbi:discoidin domain-containing protein [Candidatus Desantisbacteria bacterium]|nr:discoidin domain-containing protein [Candidatus Desantisbacteria bacterium]
MKQLTNKIMWILLIICLMPKLSEAEGIKVAATATDVGDHCAQIQWETNVETCGQVLYYPAGEFQNNLAISIGMATTHMVRLGNLLSGTMYQYQVRVKDAEGHVATSELATFTTTGIPLPLFEEIGVGSLTKTTALITAGTNVPTKLWVEYGTDTEEGHISQGNHRGLPLQLYDNKLMIRGGLRNFHQILLDGLQPDESYHFRLTAYDNDCHEVISTDHKFTTMEDNIGLYMPVTGTFVECPDDKYISHDKGFLERITDGNTGYFTGMATSGDVTLQDQFVTIDMGTIQPVDRIKVYWRKLAYSKDYSIKLSDDGKSWTMLASGINACDGIDELSDTGDPMKVIITQGGGVKARFVQVFVPCGSDFFHKHEEWRFVQLMEVKVYPCSLQELVKGGDD